MPSTMTRAFRKTKPDENLKEFSASSTGRRGFPLKKFDIPTFVDHVRQLNKEAALIANAPTGDKATKLYARKEWADVLAELEATIRTLRGATVGEAPSATRRTRDFKAFQPATRKKGDVQRAPAALVLDTTEAMVKNKQLVTPVEFQHLMGWASRQAVSKAAGSHRVFYLDYKAERYFPAFYADPAYDRKHLETVTKVLGDLPGGSKLQFFLTRKGSLGGETPLQALAAGRVAKVKDIAASFAEVPAKA